MPNQNQQPPSSQQIMTQHSTQRTLGIIGGMSWESTESYYRLINEGVKAKLGGLHSADLLIHSVDFGPINTLQETGEWEALGSLMASSGKRLQAAGAQGLMIASNTMHKLFDDVQSATDLPLIHIADATIDAIKAQNLSKIALLGTQFTMTQDFYKQRLIDAGLEVLIPAEDERAEVHRIIKKELCVGEFKDSSREYYIDVIKELTEQGAEGVILGCTEIGLLITQADSLIPVFDTTAIHAAAAVDFLLADTGL